MGNRVTAGTYSSVTSALASGIRCHCEKGNVPWLFEARKAYARQDPQLNESHDAREGDDDASFFSNLGDSARITATTKASARFGLTLNCLGASPDSAAP